MSIFRDGSNTWELTDKDEAWGLMFDAFNDSITLMLVIQDEIIYDQYIEKWVDIYHLGSPIP